MGGEPSRKNVHRMVRRPKRTYVAAFIFSFAYLCLLIFAPGFSRRGKAARSTIGQQQLLANEMLAMARFDASAKYRVLSFVLAGSRWSYFSTNSSVCVASQMTFGEIDLLMPFVNAAPGAVSVAISLARDEIVAALALLKYLLSCSASLRDKVAVHFVVPHGVDFDQAQVNFGAPLHCEQMPTEMLQLMTANGAVARVRPPAGLLRNVALEHCHNEWRVSIDPQMLFPQKVESFERNLDKFLHKKASEKGSERDAFVLPEYELIRGSMPDNKAELLSHVMDEKVKPRGHYPEAHASLKLEQWQTFKASSSKLIHAAYKLEKFNFGFQPVMITKKNGPFFDERYAEDGMAKFSQMYEMLMGSYNLYVLDNVYTCSSKGNASSRVPLASDLNTFYIKHLPELIQTYKNDPLHLHKYYHVDQKTQS